MQQQIPYLVSGSFVGLGCMVVGGILFGHWLHRIHDQAELHHEEQLRALGAIALSVRGGVLPGTGAAAGLPITGDRIEGAAYYATSSGTVYHRAECAVIGHHREELRVLAAAGVSDMQPCQICQPD